MNIEERKKMDLENRMYVETDSAHNLRLEDVTSIRNGKFAEPCLRLSDAVRIAKEYAEEMCKGQKILDKTEYLKWITRPDSEGEKTVVDYISASPLATDKEGE